MNNMKFFDLWQVEDQAAMGQGTMLTMLAMFLPFCQILKVAQVSIVAFQSGRCTCSSYGPIIDSA